MSTTTRPELSEKNPYWIERHRYYELKHFCLQYYSWKKNIASIGYHISRSGAVNMTLSGYYQPKNLPTEQLAIKRADLQRRIDLIESVCKKTDPILADYILEAVTKGISYDILRVNSNIPCNKAEYYELYRKFFWLLDKEHA